MRSKRGQQRIGDQHDHGPLRCRHSSLAPLRQQPWSFGGVEAASRLLLEGATALAALVQPQASQRTPAPAAQQEPESAMQPYTTHSVVPAPA